MNAPTFFEFINSDVEFYAFLSYNNLLITELKCKCNKEMYLNGNGNKFLCPGKCTSVTIFKKLFFF